jgi:uncharacterized protein involved in response to NO
MSEPVRPLPLHGAPPAPLSPPGSSFLAKGFRPFFLLAAGLAVLFVPAWAVMRTGAMSATGNLDSVSWHAHEMIFGFTVAVIAGFLLTAVGNWTQRETATGPALAGLCTLWLAGRVAMLSPLPSWLVAAIDLAFLAALGVTLARPIVATNNRRNFVVVAVVAVLWLANGAIHADALGVWPGVRSQAALAAIDVVTLLMVLIGGRVIPMFTRNATGDQAIRNLPRADLAAAGGVALVLIADVALASVPAARAVAYTLAAILVAARAVHWGARASLSNPLLWILHVGHAWIPIGLALRAAAALDPRVSAAAGLHALTAGAIGALTLGMMARVSLGHTGRMLAAPNIVAGAFAAMLVAALVRVVGPLAVPSLYLPWVVLSAALFAAAFLAYLVAYAPMLVGPRVDGKPG